MFLLFTFSLIEKSCFPVINRLRYFAKETFVNGWNQSSISIALAAYTMDQYILYVLIYYAYLAYLGL